MDRRGFTLIEIVLSISLVAIVLLIALSTLSFGTRLWESGYRTADKSWITRFFTTSFQNDVSSAYPYRGEDGILFKGAPDRLGFVTTSGAHAGIPWGGARLVEYAIEDGRLVLKERALPLVDGDGLTKTTELSREVQDIRFSFLGSAGWEDEWEGTEKDGLPMAVKAIVILKDDKNTAEFSIPVMLGSERTQ